MRLVEGSRCVNLSPLIEFFVIVIPLFIRNYHVGDVIVRVCTGLKYGKHVATATSLAEIQIEVTCAMIAVGLGCKTVFFLHCHNFDFRYKALSHSNGSG